MILPDKRVISGPGTLIALKDVYSYLAGTTRKGIVLVHKKKLLYKAILPSNDGMKINDIIYNRKRNVYLISLQAKILLKKVDRRPPIPILCSKSIHTPLYQPRNPNFVVFGSMYRLHVYDLSKRKICWSTPRQSHLRGYFEDFRVFGEAEEKAVSVTRGGSVSLYRMDRKRGVVCDKQLLPSAKNCMYQEFACSGCGSDYAFVSANLIDYRTFIYAYDVRADRLNLCFTYQLPRLNVRPSGSMDCFYNEQGYVVLFLQCMQHSLVLALEVEGGGGLGVRRESLTTSYALSPCKMQKIGEYYYYVGSRCQLAKIKVMVKVRR